MSYLGSFFRSFFSVQKISSREQLRLDFGEFPPKPLQCESLTGEFNVIRTSGIGQIYHELSVQSCVIDADIQSLSTDLVAGIGINQLHELKSTFERIGPRTSFFAKRALFSWMFVVRTAKAIRYGMKRSDALGLFVPYFKDEMEIFIKSQRELSKSDAPVVSHEHIHLLQYRNPESHCRHVRSPQELLTVEGQADTFILYLLQKMEVEARLHESVLSFYRAHRYLPTTVPGFLGLLASSETIRLQVINILDTGNVPFSRGLEMYPERDARPVEHLAWVLMYIKSPELKRRFITEVLPVMYANLLKYYGDHGASRSFVKYIDRPNFYDDLYAAQAA